MTRTIHVTGEKFEAPTDYSYGNLAQALSGQEDYNDGELWSIIQDDAEDWAERILRMGPGEDNTYPFSIAASFLTSEQETLEIILQEGSEPENVGTPLWTGGPEGVLTIRGDVKSTELDHENFFLYIDGNVDDLKAPDFGVVYVAGNVGKLTGLNAYNFGTVIVSGEINEIPPVSFFHYSGPGVDAEFFRPLPFLFTPREYEIMGERARGFGPWEAVIQKSYAVDPERLKGITPESLKQESTNLGIESYVSRSSRSRVSQRLLSQFDPTNNESFAKKLSYTPLEKTMTWEKLHPAKTA